jgi:hypothetical protein
MHGTKLNNMTKNKTKDSDLSCHTQWIHGVGGRGGLNWIKRGKNFNFAPLLFEIKHCSTAGRAGFIGLFIGHYYWYRLA